MTRRIQAILGAFVVVSSLAIAQVLLVDVDYVLSGERTVAAGAASALVLLVSWGAAGLVYRRIAPPTRG